MNWRLIIGFAMFAGFPAWMWWWIQSPNMLTYIYAVMGYAVLALYLAATGIDRHWQKSGM